MPFQGLRRDLAGVLPAPRSRIDLRTLVPFSHFFAPIPSIAFPLSESTSLLRMTKVTNVGRWLSNVLHDFWTPSYFGEPKTYFICRINRILSGRLLYLLRSATNMIKRRRRCSEQSSISMASSIRKAPWACSKCNCSCAFCAITGLGSSRFHGAVASFIC